MKKTFKRSDIKLKTEDFIKELERELIMRKAVYTKQVKEKKLSEYQANKRYLIILELKELMQLAEKRAIQFKQLKKWVEDWESQSTAKQSAIQFPN